MVSALLPLARGLRSGLGLCALQRGGLDGITEPDQTIEGIAERALEAIRREQPTGPYYLGGHSLGAWIALEVARALERQGERVGLLAVLDMPAPAHGPSGAPHDEDRLLATLLEIVEAVCGRPLALSPDGLRGLPLDAQLERVRQEMIRVDALAPGASLDQVRGLLRVLTADEQALASYERQGEPTDLPIVLFRTAQAWHHSPGEPAGEETWGWKEVSARAVVVNRVPGDHGSMLRSPHVSSLAAGLDECLERAMRESDR
jgi:thioesterase domain-containing protein